MTRSKLAICAALLSLSAVTLAESKNPSDYPLRLNIFNRSQTTFYHHESVDEAKGEGRANLFANNDVRGVDFSYECSEKLRASFGYETYPAKWKKPNQELIVLLPVFGKTGSYFTCNLKTDVKDHAYLVQNGRLAEESPESFKAWMVKHDYDPEHGKNTPVRLPDQRAGSGQYEAARP